MSTTLAPLRTPTFTWEWGRRTYVMGIVNVTPDSFSGDGLAGQLDAVVERARAMIAAGADVIDVGGESTRPGYTPVPAEEELRRVIPAIEALADAIDVPISIDTSKAVVAEAALKAGAHIVNDIRGLSADPEIAAVAAAAGAPVVIMHDLKIETEDRLIPDIVRELSLRIERALAAGIPWEHIIIDPGFGFGKTAELNLVLLRRLRELTVLGRPILAGTSRKSTIGRVLGTDPDDRVEGTAATVALAIANGADIVRVHDVPQMVRVARMTDAVVRGWSE
ncbi:dihydropteroate synthase [Sphaerobacter thermophilus]|uniref:Dihydropteroate synthase n=1 Tax=Sphaerobacter thermophilus (strain ATCC 49802 / DSM 20745 / KCCM 41009 / NCIMB 13125 / S 6022) TaxID=479434 RepID=D1C536_SPHTD|nr:dihydropteroate synthase [Sphaerobacter thermophilus]ACZ39353.1 dihydropteroate synthase [Sphaerobacter thermophilus DSM 20745]PZN62873.1 MAG: dihydropteroate synthase [Sphaerobacter thermophilus]